MSAWVGADRQAEAPAPGLKQWLNPRLCLASNIVRPAERTPAEVIIWNATAAAGDAHRLANSSTTAGRRRPLVHSSTRHARQSGSDTCLRFHVFHFQHLRRPSHPRKKKTVIQPRILSCRYAPPAGRANLRFRSFPDQTACAAQGAPASRPGPPPARAAAAPALSRGPGRP